jgi:NF-X1-type zinc finger protein NFXL1
VQGCHDAPPPPVAAWEQPKPPKNVAEAAAAAAGAGSSKRRGGDAAAAALPPEPPGQVAAATAAALAGGGSGAHTSCPPCMAPVSLPCFGGHCSSEMPCHQAAHFACPGACGRPLPCGHHSCGKLCHVLEPAALAAAAGTLGFDPAAAAVAARSLPSAAAPCEVCARPCGVRRAGCDHPCPSSCHTGACSPCAVQRTQPCFCGKTTLSFECHELQRLQKAASTGGDKGGGSGGAAAAAAALSCGKPCHRALPGCQHPCRTACHAGVCPAACEEEVAVRCECRRLKQKWPCAKVRAALQKATGSGDYDSGATSLKLLPCDAECAAQAKAKKRDAPDGAAAAPAAAAGAAPPPPRGAAAAEAAKPVAASASAKRMSRAEREAVQAARAAQQLAEERRKKWMAKAGTLAAGAAAVTLAILLFWLANRLIFGPGAQDEL